MSGSSIEELNEIQAKLIISELIKCSCDQFVISPGSRSTSLVLAILDDPMAKSTIHFDERGAGFYAYGLAKATRRPVCLIVTSGTAVANLMPAAVEAKKDNVPLILLTADRPPELHDCGSNQTMRQDNFFSMAVKDEFNIPPPTQKISKKSLTRRIDQACHQATKAPMGPVHINVMIPEPFFSKNGRKCSAIHSSPLPATTYHTVFSTLSQDKLEYIAAQYSGIEKGLIVVGELPNDEDLNPILHLAMKLQWPLFADTGSGLRSLGRDTTLIPFYNHILQTTYSKEKMIPDAILYLGANVVSKPLFAWLSTINCNKFTHVIDSSFSHDSIHSVTDHIEMNVSAFCHAISKKVTPRVPSYWLSLWKEYSLHIEEILESFFKECPELNEPYTIFSFIEHLHSDVDVFFSNSLPIRYADSFLFPKQEIGNLYSKRGLSGIDGVLSMGLGIAAGTKKPLICVIGDIAFLHDINSLALLKEKNLPITIILLNNGGGGIFHFLPIATKKEECSTYWVQKHRKTFEKYAAAFEIPYKKLTNLADYHHFLSLSAEERGLCILEIQTDGEKNYNLHLEIEEYLKKKMMRSKKEKELCYFALGKVK